MLLPPQPTASELYAIDTMDAVHHHLGLNMLLHSIQLKRLLSFGDDGIDLPLQPLNVLIGPNGSGKSNLLEAISLLHAAPTQLAEPVRRGGGILDWVWRREPGTSAQLEVVVDFPPGNQSLRHSLEFTDRSQKFHLVDERVEGSATDLYYHFRGGQPVIKIKNQPPRELEQGDVDGERSILSQRVDPDQYPEITHLGKAYGQIRFYRDWSFGRNTVLRQPQRADLPNDWLQGDGSNLGLVLNKLRQTSSVKQTLLENLRQLYDGIEDFEVYIEGGTVQVFFQESGFAIPATRLSDGTLRYLCLLAILCHPSPPPLVCIEEPELGLHPDMMPTIARLLKSASERMQLIVTTHSDILIDELSDQPESVVVCEKEQGQTKMQRLSESDLSEWLQKYRLGQLWTQGELGGVRW